jgi:UDP-glucose 6-dehydrogenase
MTLGLGSRVRLGVALMVIACAMPTAHADAYDTELRFEEYRVRAAFLVNVTKFVQWLDDAALAFCTTGDRFFAVATGDAVGHSSTGSHEIVVRTLEPKEDFTQCQTVFIVTFVARDTAAILKQVQELPVLTIGESPSFLSEGGAVRVFIENNRIRFNVGGGAAEKKGLKIGSQLLALAAR